MQTSLIHVMLARRGFAVAAVVLTLAPGLTVGPSWSATDLLLSFPAGAVVTADLSEPLASYQMPIGPLADGKIPTLQIEGRLKQQVWRVGDSAASTMDALVPLRDQVTAAGFAVIFECEAEACGGFDFRYGTEVLPEPDMHVDLGDFRFMSAKRDGAGGAEYLSLLVSRSPLDGYVQLTRIGALEVPAPDLTASSKTPMADAAPAAAAPSLNNLALERAVPPVSGDADTALGGGLPLVLEDLVFASGAAELQAGEYASLAALAGWLKVNPEQAVLLVGHTDASGGLEANIALSKRRAASVRQALVSGYDIPAAQLTAHGVGPLSPRASNLDAEGRTKNRRVEVFTTSTQ